MSTLAPFRHTTPALSALIATAFLLTENNDPEKHRDNLYWIFPGPTHVRGQLETREHSYAPFSARVEGFHLGRNPVQIYDFSHTESVFVHLRASTCEIQDRTKTVDIGSFSVEITPPYKQVFRQKYHKSFSYIFDSNGERIEFATALITFPDIGDIVVHWIRSCLADSFISSVIVCSDGTTHKIPSSYWRSTDAHTVFEYQAPTQIIIDGRTIFGLVFISFTELYKSLETIANTKNDPANNPILNDNPSPYISFMLRASNALGLVNGYQNDGSRLVKDSVEQWIDANWPLELGRKSPALISSMATLMRHPQAARGGNIKVAGAAPNGQLEDQRSGPKI